jgi:hypothetical protein
MAWENSGVTLSEFAQLAPRYPWFLRSTQIVRTLAQLARTTKPEGRGTGSAGSWLQCVGDFARISH